MKVKTLIEALQNIEQDNPGLDVYIDFERGLLELDEVNLGYLAKHKPHKDQWQSYQGIENKGEEVVIL